MGALLGGCGGVEIGALFLKSTGSLMNSHCRAPTMMSLGVPRLQLLQLEQAEDMY